MRWYADWLRRQMKNLGVCVRYHCTPQVDDLKSFGAVIVATGARIVRPDVPGIDLPCVCTFEGVLRCTVERCEYHFPGKSSPVKCGEAVLVWGDHFGAADAAEKLAADGKKVYVVTENREFASWMEPCHRDVMFKRFAGSNGEGLKGKPFEKPVTVISNSTVVDIRESGEVTLMDHRFQKSAIRVDNLVLARVEPDDTICTPLEEAGVVVVKIGDAKRVRNLRAAVTEGANAGLVLDEGLRLNANSALISTA
jgi:thioredoxin reductase